MAQYIRATYSRSGFTVDVDNTIFMNWDHAPFALEGIPVGSLTAKWPVGTQLHFGHTPADSLDKIDVQDMRYAACCATLLVLEVANDESWSIGHRTSAQVNEVLKAAGKANVGEFHFAGRDPSNR